MSRDVWMRQIRIAATDTPAVEAALSGSVPVDGLQHAGSAILRVERSDALVAIAGLVVDALGERGWTGDAELVAELELYSSRARGPGTSTCSGSLRSSIIRISQRASLTRLSGVVRLGGFNVS